MSGGTLLTLLDFSFLRFELINAIQLLTTQQYAKRLP